VLFLAIDTTQGILGMKTAIKGTQKTAEILSSRAQKRLREAGAGGSNPLAPTIQHIDIAITSRANPEGAGQCSQERLSLFTAPKRREAQPSPYNVWAGGVR
jgi:hypothetical protein